MPITDKLEFSLPPFRRITWVSEALKAEWEPRIAQLAQVIDSVFTSAGIMEIVPVQIRHIRAGDLYEYKKEIGAKGLFVQHLDALPMAVQYAFGLEKEENSYPVIIGNRRNVVDFIRCINDPCKAAAIAGLPEGTIKYWQQFTLHGLMDAQWACLLSAGNEFAQCSMRENNILNTCWAGLGISAIPYRPAGLDCAESIEKAGTVKSIVKSLMPAELYNAWYEALSWPCEWSAAHGIAEIKTPVFKMIYNTDATGKKYSISFTSNAYPEKGLNGLLFPYRKPKKLFLSDSEKFKTGAAHLDASLKISPDS